MGSNAARRIGLAVAAIVVLGVCPGVASAGIITPNTTRDQFNTDASRCSLREAIWASNNDSNAEAPGCSAGSGVDLVLVPNGQYRLSIPGTGENQARTGDLDITEVTHLRSRVFHFGRAGAHVVIDGGGLDRVIEVFASSPVTPRSVGINGVTIRGGAGGAFGGGIAVSPGGSLSVGDSTIADNASSSFGGGVGVANGAYAALVDVTVSGNRTTDRGGGIGVSAGDLFLANVTVSNNAADTDGSGDDGGGISVGGASNARALNSIVSANRDGSPPGTGDRPDCDGGLSSLGHNNLFGDPRGCGALDATDVSGEPPGLLPLADNGGPARTHALAADSPAVGLGDWMSCVAIGGRDQRGVPRWRPMRCDAGAYQRVLCGGVLVNVVGTRGPNKLRGTPRRDGILGLYGDDVLRGLGRADGICGGKGRDRLFGGKGRDLLLGGPGFDRLFGGPGNDLLNGGAGRDLCVGGAGRNRYLRCSVRR